MGGERASARALAEWRNRVAAEYRSAALAAQVLHWAIQVGLPDPLVKTALRVVRDELDHADLSHDCMVALGGDDDAQPMEVANLAEPDLPEGVLASLLDSLLVNFCLGETFAVPLFAAMRRHTTHPAARPVLDRVLKDEAVHRGFGWDTLDALLEVDAIGVRGRVQAQLPAALASFERAYAARAGPPLTDAERAAGLLDLADYDEVFWWTLREDIGPRFEKRGISLPDRYRRAPATA